MSVEVLATTRCSKICIIPF